MSTAALTTAYRPQSFGDVAGQETIKAILSRAALEDRIAPAYLFSGTRGVGKTTIARIFAKALNCEKAPTAEPCNECEHCKKITQGIHVDVVEIDGASNRGIDDARRLRESIGYAAMEGRYKVFIIDEAHMLTREAFNALLKTLEEPPPNVTFIMATTESHKFPVTIVSRCQHYTFKRLGEQELEAHLTKILGFEQRGFEPAAVKLIARRAAGSVRDSMSLLGQVLALGHETLSEEAVRSILGLAGQELFFNVMEAMKAQDVVAVSGVIRSILDQGVDIGFFLRELAATWRNLFMLKQAGENALPLLDLPEDEAQKWLEWVPQFELSHVHACWQLTLEGQRRVLTSLEPAMALELLLLNLTFLPKLLSMEHVSKGGQSSGAASGTASGSSAGAAPSGQNAPGMQPPYGGASGQQSAAMPQRPSSQMATPQANAYQPPQPPPMPQGAPAGGQSPVPPHRQQAAATVPPHRQSQQSTPPPWDNAPPPVNDAPPPDLPPEYGGMQSGVPQGATAHGMPPQAGGNRSSSEDGETNQQPLPSNDWERFLLFCKEQNGEGGKSVSILESATGSVDGAAITVQTRSSMQYDKLSDAETQGLLTMRARELFGDGATLTILEPTTKVRSYHELKQEVEAHPTAQLLQQELGAQLLTFKHKDEPNT